jgi:hypothetical protein
MVIVGYFFFFPFLFFLSGQIATLEELSRARLSIPNYQRKIESIDPLIICEKIENKEFQKFCLSKLETKNDREFASSFLYKYLGNYCYQKDNKGKCCLYYGKESYNPETFNQMLAIHGFYKSHPNYIYYYKALIENPYFCEKMLSFMFDGPKREDCYRDAALVWHDPYLCERAKDKDFCYFCIAIEEP